VVNYANGLMHRLDEGGMDAGSAREALENISRAGQRAKDILNHVGDFVRRGNPELSAERVADLVADVHAMLRQRLLRNNVYFDNRLKQVDTRVDVNRVEIKQVLFNLINNSIESLQQSSGVDRGITVDLDADTPAFVTLSVCDNGPGIEPGVAENLFEPYVTTKDGGLGMGLSICRTIIESHGGRLWHQAGEGRGACLCFRLPIAGAGDE